MWTVLARKRGMRDELILGRGEGQVILMGGRWYRGAEPDGADVAGCLVEISWCTSLDEPWCGVTDDLSASILTAPFLLSCWLVHCMILIRPSQGTQAANASDGMDAEGKIKPKFRKKSNKPSLTRKKNCSACCNRQKRSDEKSGEVWCPPICLHTFTFSATYGPLVTKYTHTSTFAMNLNQSHGLLTNPKEAIYGLVCHHLVCDWNLSGAWANNARCWWMWFCMMNKSDPGFEGLLCKQC